MKSTSERITVVKNRFTMMAVFLFLAVAPFQSVSAAEMTEETGQQILKELQSIRKFIEKEQKPAIMAPPAAPERPQSKVAGGYAFGREDAPLVLVEYTDYQCFYCKRFYESAYQEIKKNYIDTGKLRFISRNLPLGFHAFAQKAAQAVYCAGEQGQYLAMKKQLFAAKSGLEPSALTEYAREIGLNDQTFKTCIEGNASLKAIRDEAKSAEALGITGTPSFFLGINSGAEISGQIIVGAQPYETFAALFDELLAQAPAAR